MLNTAITLSDLITVFGLALAVISVIINQSREGKKQASTLAVLSEKMDRTFADLSKMQNDFKALQDGFYKHDSDEGKHFVRLEESVRNLSDRIVDAETKIDDTTASGKNLFDAMRREVSAAILQHTKQLEDHEKRIIRLESSHVHADH